MREGAFAEGALESIVFEPGCCLKSIGRGAFNGTPNLGAIVIPASVCYIGPMAFGESSVVRISFEPGSGLEDRLDDILQGAEVSVD